MDRKEMETKLTKHGLPTWGEDAQLKARLEANGIISPCPTLGVEHKRIGKVLSTYIDKDFSNNGEPHDIVVTDEPAPRKMGRPKKVK